MYYHQKEKISHRIVADEAVIVNLDSGEMTVLNPAGAKVWIELNDGKSIEQVADELKNFCLEISVYALNEFVEELCIKGLLRKSNEPSNLKTKIADTISKDKLEALPQIISYEKLETLAGICGSGYTGEAMADCRTSGLGCWDIAT